MHTREDIWIQKKLAFTPAKNATKPNPFKIIPLRPTRKENNWETEETLERGTVTLETERAKRPNPGCLWWWWWCMYACGVGWRRQYSDSLWARRCGDQIPVGGKILRTCPDQTWGPPSLLYNGYWVSFLGGKAARVWHSPPTPSSAKVKERVEL